MPGDARNSSSKRSRNSMAEEMSAFSRGSVTPGEKTRPPWQQPEGSAVGTGSHDPAEG